VPEEWLSRGGLLLPMYKSEALWLNFSGDYPMAVKIAAGKINAVTGELWENHLIKDPQDYIVVPDQPWLDGFCVEKDLIRQFVAMPLGRGYSVEEQITGEAEFGGIQIIVYPMKSEDYEKYIEENSFSDSIVGCLELSEDFMGLAPGGLMRQEIYKDDFGFDVWDTEQTSRCFIHLVNSEAYQAITGEQPPQPPITSKEYQQHGIPWFDYYAENKSSVTASEKLAGLKSISEIASSKVKAIWDKGSINIGSVNQISTKQNNIVSEGEDLVNKTEMKMNQDGMSIAFDVILEELDSVIKEVNKDGSAAFEKGIYSDAERFSLTGKNLLVFKEELEKLETKWATDFDLETKGRIEIEPIPVRTVKPHTKGKRTNLLIKYDNKNIQENTAAEGLIKAISEMNI